MDQPSTPAAPTSAALRRALRRSRDGVALDVTEAAVLLAARGEQLDELLVAASRVRDAGLVAEGRPGVVTYSRKVFIPLTRLCRDRCHYCTFATVPHRLPAAFLEREEVLEIARAGAAAGCKEALFTLGDRPEERWPAAREWLEARGYDSTLAYVRACAIAVLEETGLLPHLNPGVMSWAELTRLKPVAPSMGMMLETTATRLWSEPGGPHYGSPDKEPAVRLRTLTDAGRVGVPFTTGILIGIGENLTERAESLFAIRSVARAHGHIQETIVQNFRAKPDTAMRNDPDADLEDLAATIAVARLVLGPEDAAAGPAEPGRGGVRADAAGRHRRLGRRLPGDRGPRQPGAAVAGDRRAGRALGRGRVHPARAAHRVPALRAGRLAVDRHPAARARRRAGRPGDRARPRGRGRRRPALAGAGRRVRQQRPGRPEHRDRLGGAHRGPARRLRLGLRRLGRAALGAGGHPAGRAGAARLRRPGRARRWPVRTRRRCSIRRTPRPRWR